MKTFLFILLFLSASFAKDFIALKESIKAQNSVIEIFSYKCIHCYNHHRFKTLQKLKNKMPHLHYAIYPISIADSKYGRLLNEFFAYALYEDEKRGQDASDEDSLSHRLAGVYFEHFFVKNDAGVVVSAKEFSDEKSFSSLAFSTLQTDREKLNSFLKSDEAKALLRRFEWANEVAKNFGTPAFVINGTYQIKPEAIISLENLEKIIKNLSKL